MNRTLLPIYSLLLAGAVGTWQVNANAQEAVTRTRTETSAVTSAGTITQFAPGSESITIRTEHGAEPIPYALTSKTVYVDENGTPIAVNRITTGEPVTVHYIREGDRMVASRVVVRTAGPGAVEERRTTTVVPAAPPVVEEHRTTTVTPAPPVVEEHRTTTTTTTTQPEIIRDRKLSHEEKEALEEKRKAERHEEKAERHEEKAARGE